MKKTNIKRFFVLFCVLACVFSMTACTNTISSDSAKTSLKDMKVNQYASDMVQWAEDMHRLKQMAKQQRHSAM